MVVVEGRKRTRLLAELVGEGLALKACRGVPPSIPIKQNGSLSNNCNVILMDKVTQ